jgi:hypothetical protein
MRAIVNQETAPRPAKRKIIRASPAASGENVSVSHSLKTVSSVVISTMTKMIEGSE